LGNIVLTPDGPFGLIDIADLRSQARPLFTYQRRRNLQHLQRDPFDRQWLTTKPEQDVPTTSGSLAVMSTPYEN
jgi:hypothetical protein